MAMRLCGYVALRLCGYVAIWLSRGVQLCGYSELCTHPPASGRLLVSWSHLVISEDAHNDSLYSLAFSLYDN